LTKEVCVVDVRLESKLLPRTRN